MGVSTRVEVPPFPEGPFRVMLPDGSTYLHDKRNRENDRPSINAELMSAQLEREPGHRFDTLSYEGQEALLAFSSDVCHQIMGITNSLEDSVEAGMIIFNEFSPDNLPKWGSDGE